MSLQQYIPYSWHQSHDQVTVLFAVPYDTEDEDVLVTIERTYLVAGVHNQEPIAKGRLYGAADTANSTWQLEPRSSRRNARERTISATSTASSPSSYAVVSDPEMSSSFVASVESAQASDAEEIVALSSTLPSPVSASFTDSTGMPLHSSHQVSASASRPDSPQARPLLSIASSLSSLESPYASHSSRLLTLHLEKEESGIWPCLIAGPVPEYISPCPREPLTSSPGPELKYNMDPTSLVLLGYEWYDIRRDTDEAFEYFARAWKRARVPSAALRIAVKYLPIQSSYQKIQINTGKDPVRGHRAYYIKSIGGHIALAELYLEVGLLHLDGSASSLPMSHSALSSIRAPEPQSYSSRCGESGTEAWKRNRGLARQYFGRARELHPSLEVPVIPPDTEMPNTRCPSYDPGLQMPSIDLRPRRGKPDPSVQHGSRSNLHILRQRRRGKEEDLSVMSQSREAEAEDGTWYLYISGIVGAGTALLVVGVIGALSVSSWRKNQGS